MNSFIAISDVRTQLPSLVDRISKNLERFIITVNGQPKAVVLSLEELESLEETAEILAIPQAKESIKRGICQAKKRQGVSLDKILD